MPTSSHHSSASTSGKELQKPSRNRTHTDATSSAPFVLSLQHHDSGEQRIRPQAEDQTRDQDEGAGLSDVLEEKYV